MVRPVRPDRLLRAGLALRRWGSTPRGAFTVNAITRTDQTALIDDEGPVTFAEVEPHTNAIARGLADAGLGARRAASGSCAATESGFVETMVACSKLGADALLLNTSMSGAELEAACSTASGPRVLVHDEEFADVVRGDAAASASRSAGRAARPNAVSRGRPLAARPARRGRAAR